MSRYLDEVEKGTGVFTEFIVNDPFISFWQMLYHLLRGNIAGIILIHSSKNIYKKGKSGK